MPGQRSFVCTRVEPEQYFYFRANFVRDLTTLEVSFPLIRREVGKLVEESLNLAFQLVSPIPLSRYPLSDELNSFLQFT